MGTVQLGPAIGWPTTGRMQWEAYPSWLRSHPNVWPDDLRSFLKLARGKGLTQVHAVKDFGQIMVIATKPGDPTGKEVLV